MGKDASDALDHWRCYFIGASTQTCVNQAGSFGSNSFTLQFHLEITPEIIKKWIDAWSDELEEVNGSGAGENVIKETGSIWSTYYQLANRIINNWLTRIS